MKVKSIEYAGGACPYQCEGRFEDGRYFYLRYRGGRLVLHVHENVGMLYGIQESIVFEEKIGGEYEGWANDELFHEKLDNIIEFPVGFKFLSYS